MTNRLLSVLILVFLVVGCDSADPLASIDNERLRENGLDPEFIGPLLTELSKGNYGAVESIVIRRNDKIAIDAYFRGLNRNVLTNVYGITSGITSLLTGIALDDTLNLARDSLLAPLLPEYNDVSRREEFEEITIEHLLDMRTGFFWNETSLPYIFSGNPRNSLEFSSDWIRHVMTQDFISEPGEEWVLNTGNSILLTAALTARLDSTLEAYAAEKLFEPLGIETWQWSKGRPDGLTNGGWGLFVFPTDLSKIGQLILNEGMYDGEQVVPKEWIQGLYEPSHIFTDGNGYNDMWWLGKGREIVVDDFILYGRGSGGQFMYIVPSFDLVVVTTGANFIQPTDMKSILWDYIFPAML